METQNEETSFDYMRDGLKAHKYTLYKDRLFYKILDKMFQKKYDKLIELAKLKNIDIPINYNQRDIRTAPDYEKLRKKACVKQSKILSKHKIYKNYFLQNNDIKNYITNSSDWFNKDISFYKNKCNNDKKDVCFDFYITKELFDLFHQNSDLEYLFKYPVEYLHQYLYRSTEQDKEEYEEFFYSNLYKLNLKEKIKITRRASIEQLSKQISINAYPDIVLEYIYNQYIDDKIPFVTCWKHKKRIPYIMSVKEKSENGKEIYGCLPIYSCSRKGKNDSYNSMNRWLMEAIRV